MKQIRIRPSRIIVGPYSKGDSFQLEKDLSLFDYNLHKVTLDLSIIRNNCIYVPRGYGIEPTIRKLESNAIYDLEQFEELDHYATPRSVSIKMKPGVGAKDDHQINSISFLIEDNMKQKYLNLDTGFGKTFCAVKTASMLGLATCVIMSNSNLMEQWKKVIKEYTYCKDEDIYLIQGRDTFESAIKKHNDAKFYICSTSTMSILAEEDKLQEFMEKCGIGVKIIDEAHERMRATFAIDLSCDVKYNIYLSATPIRSDSRENVLYKRCTKTFVTFGSYTNELNNYLHVKNVYINTEPAPFHKMICKTKNGFSAIIYEKFLFKNNRKKTFIYLIIKYLALRIIDRDPSAKVLVILSLKDSVNEIAGLFKGNDGINCGVFTSDVEGDKKKKQLENNIILSTIKSSGTGLDIKNLRVIINFVPFKSEVLLHQLFGRIRYIDGKAVFYFNIVDTGFDDIKRQNFHRQRFFRNKSQDITDMQLDMNKLLENLNGF